MSRISRLRRIQREIYDKQRRDFLREHPRCEVRVSMLTGEPVHRHSKEIGTVQCKRSATQVHHVRGRGRWYLDKQYWLAVEQRHHAWITSHGKLAEVLGYIERVYEQH
jgi:hypothetical protein